MQKVPPTLMPAHKSKNLTLAQARRAWLKVLAKDEARRSKRKSAPKRSSASAA